MSAAASPASSDRPSIKPFKMSRTIMSSEKTEKPSFP
jgi:hypothetical protein